MNTGSFKGRVCRDEREFEASGEEVCGCVSSRMIAAFDVEGGPK